MNHVTNTILEHLGQQFPTVTGARNFVRAADSLTFDLSKARKIRITLCDNGLYRIELFKWRRKAMWLEPLFHIDNVEDIMLARAFTSMTGLLTKL